jgi:hypothetical protein
MGTLLGEQAFLILLALQILYIFPLIIVGIFLLIKVMKSKLNNLVPLVIFFFLNGIEVVLLVVGAPFILYNVIVFFSNISLIIFTRAMFYKDKRSPFKYIIGMAIIVKIIDFILRSFIPYPSDETLELGPPGMPFYYLNLVLTVSMVLLSYPWLAYASLSSYKSIKDKPVNPWIKKRYLIIGIAVSFTSLNSIFYIFLPYTPDLLDNLQYVIMAILIASMNTIFSIGNVIGWMMPQKLKDYFDSNFKPTLFEIIPEEELIEKIKNELARTE